MGSQLTRGLQDQISQLVYLCILGGSDRQILLQYWEQIRGCFTTTGDRVSQDVVSFEDRWDGLSLNDRWVIVLQVRARPNQRFCQHQLLEHGKVFFVIMHFGLLADQGFRFLNFFTFLRKDDFFNVDVIFLQSLLHRQLFLLLLSICCIKRLIFTQCWSLGLLSLGHLERPRRLLGSIITSEKFIIFI